MNQINDYIDEHVNITFIDHIHPHFPVLPRSSTTYPPSFIFSLCVCPFLCVSMTASLSIKFILYCPIAPGCRTLPSVWSIYPKQPNAKSSSVRDEVSVLYPRILSGSN